MPLRFSAGARQFMAIYGSYKDAFQNGRMELYSGAQPATADAAVTGVLLCTITAASAARTSEVRASGTVTLNTGAAGSVDTLTVNGVDILGGAVAYNTSLTQTAADVVTRIGQQKSVVEYQVTSSGAVITIRALPGTGTFPNGFVVASSATTITKTDANMASGVFAINGLALGLSAAGVLDKLPSQTWSGLNAATGTAGYYRFYGGDADAGGLDATGLTVREDGAIATSGAELNMANPTLAVSATTTITSWQTTIPGV